MKKLSLALVLLLLFGAAFALKSKTPQTPPGKYADRNEPSVRGSSHLPRHPLDDVYSNRDTVRIPDFPGDTAVSRITIDAATTINHLNIYVNIHHTWVRDLYIEVSGPGDTTRVVLLNLLPRDDAVNIIGWFNDQAADSIMRVDTPLVGEWQPLEPLSRFTGLSAQGTWTLRVYDRFRVDSGYIAMWSVEVNRRFILTGIVRNAETNLPLSGVRVELLPGNFVTYSLLSGVYGLSGVPTGIYTAQFTKTNYDTLLLSDLALDSSTTTPRNVQMLTIPGLHELASTAAPVDIPDADTSGATMSLTVQDSAIIGDLDVLVNVEHPAAHYDLFLRLTSPDGVRLLLSTPVAEDGENYTNCRFDDEASTLITQGHPPFTGRYRPVQPLSGLIGHNMQGLWQFTVVDTSALGVGQILNYTLFITEQTAAAQPRVHAPADFSFAGNYPNPFNSRTIFRFSVPATMDVRLTLYNLMGQEVARIFESRVTAGNHEVTFDAGRLPSGVYVARLSAGSQSVCRKMVLLK